jgi:hypothetical protein
MYQYIQQEPFKFAFMQLTNQNKKKQPMTIKFLYIKNYQINFDMFSLMPYLITFRLTSGFHQDVILSWYGSMRVGM